MAHEALPRAEGDDSAKMSRGRSLQESDKTLLQPDLFDRAFSLQRGSKAL